MAGFMKLTVVFNAAKALCGYIEPQAARVGVRRQPFATRMIKGRSRFDVHLLSFTNHISPTAWTFVHFACRSPGRTRPFATAAGVAQVRAHSPWVVAPSAAIGITSISRACAKRRVLALDGHNASLVLSAHGSMLQQPYRKIR